MSQKCCTMYPSHLNLLRTQLCYQKPGFHMFSPVKHPNKVVTHKRNYEPIFNFVPFQLLSLFSFELASVQRLENSWSFTASHYPFTCRIPKHHWKLVINSCSDKTNGDAKANLHSLIKKRKLSSFNCHLTLHLI